MHKIWPYNILPFTLVRTASFQMNPVLCGVSCCAAATTVIRTTIPKINKLHNFWKSTRWQLARWKFYNWVHTLVYEISMHAMLIKIQSWNKNCTMHISKLFDTKTWFKQVKTPPLLSSWVFVVLISTNCIARNIHINITMLC